MIETSRPFDLERLDERIDDPLRDLGDGVVGSRPGADDRELVATVARDEVLLAHAAGQSRRDLA